MARNRFKSNKNTQIHPFADDMGRCIGCCPGGSFSDMRSQGSNSGIGGNQFGKNTNFNKSPYDSDASDINSGGMYGLGEGIGDRTRRIGKQKLPNAPECFVAGTTVRMSDGFDKNIEDVKVGDEVLSYNTKTDDFENQLVTELYTQTHNLKDGDFTVKIKFSNGIVTHNTIANPFWAKDKGFVAVDEKRCNRVHQWVIASNSGNDIDGLYVNDILYSYTDDGILEEVTVDSIDHVMEKDIRTYDINVESTHTFFANNILTHNSSGPTPTPTPTPTPAPNRYCMDQIADNYLLLCGSADNGCDSGTDLLGNTINCYDTYGGCSTNCCCNYFTHECAEGGCCHAAGLSNECCEGGSCYPCDASGGNAGQSLSDCYS